MSDIHCKELWYTGPNGEQLCALINDGSGWLMYLRDPEDVGFSSRNPDYDGPADATIDYVLSNGQVDGYPAAWAYPTDIVMKAVEHFILTGLAAPFVRWHNDAGDGQEPPLESIDNVVKRTYPP